VVALLVIAAFAAREFLFAAGTYRLIGDRSVYAAGACVEYDPTSGDNHRTVFLDPGHGGPDPGASGTGPIGKPLYEKDLTLPVAMDTVGILRGRGYHVAIARNEDQAVARIRGGSLAGGAYTPQGIHAEIAARAECANESGAQLLLSIHFNSYGDPSVGGAETLYDPSRPFTSKNLRLATLIQSSVLQGFAARGWHVPDRGVQPDTVAGTPALTAQGAAYGHLLQLGPAAPGWFEHPSTMPGALSEPLFLTDSGEAAVSASADGRHVLAEAFAQAIDRYFSGK
jgi:N-acetylmuramoyl-L-alanine amidase